MSDRPHLRDVSHLTIGFGRDGHATVIVAMADGTARYHPLDVCGMDGDEIEAHWLRVRANTRMENDDGN